MKQLLPLIIVLIFASIGCRPAAPESAVEVRATETATQPPARFTSTPVPPTTTPTPTALTPTETNTSVPTVEPPTMTPTPAPIPDVETMWGRWALPLFVLTLKPDGTYTVTWPSEPDEPTYELGTYTFDQGVLRLVPETYDEATPNPTLDGCREKQAYSYAATLLPDPRFMKLKQISDFCMFRVRHWDSAGTANDEVWQQLETFSAGQ